MIIGIPKEIKDKENRVGLIPCFAESLIKSGHNVIIERGAGANSGFLDEEYLAVGAKILDTAADIYKGADMIVKVKEPLESEYELIQDGQILFTYLHLAPDPQQTQALIKSNAVCIAYETVTDECGRLPLLAPMSIIAGRSSTMIGAYLLQKHLGGLGVLISGVPGTYPANVVVLGGGCVGTNAAIIAVGLRANVTVFDNNLNALQRLDDTFKGSVNAVYSSQQSIHEALRTADLVIGAALVPGANAPKIVTKNMIKSMKPGSVIVDVAIDQGGCIETSRPTTHSHPTYTVDGVLHYCVTNIPGAYARTSTISLNNATYPYIEKLARMGYRDALLSDDGLMEGLNVFKGKVTCKAVADAQGLNYSDPKLELGR